MQFITERGKHKMARYSEVSLIMKKSDFLDLVVYAQEREEKRLYNLIKGADDIHEYTEDDAILLHWGFYAWCDWYSDVEELYSYLENVPYLLYRIGEEWDDVENIDNDWEGSCPVEILREMQIDNREATKIELEDLVTSLAT